MSFSLRKSITNQNSLGDVFNANALVGLPIGPMDGIAATNVLSWDGTEWVFGIAGAGTLSCVDGVVDGVGGSAGVYATLTAAAAGGARNICVTASYSETGTITGTGAICVSSGPGIIVTCSAATTFSGFDAITIKGCGREASQSVFILTGVALFCTSGTKLYMDKCAFVLDAITSFSDDTTQITQCDFDGGGFATIPSSFLTLESNSFSIPTTLFSAAFDSPNSVISGNSFTSVTMPPFAPRTGVIFSNNTCSGSFTLTGIMSDIQVDSNRFSTSVSITSFNNSLFTDNVCQGTFTASSAMGTSTVSGNVFNGLVSFTAGSNSSSIGNNIMTGALVFGPLDTTSLSGNTVIGSVNIGGLSSAAMDNNNFESTVTVSGAITDSSISGNIMTGAFDSSLSCTDTTFIGNTGTSMDFEIISGCAIGLNRFSTFTCSTSSTGSTFNGNVGTSMSFTLPTLNSVTGNHMSGAIVTAASATNIVTGNRVAAGGVSSWAITETITVTGADGINVAV